MPEPTITSRKHPLLRRVAAVRAGRETDAVVLEGERLIADAARAGVRFQILLAADDREPSAEIARIDAPMRRVAADALASSSALDTPPGLVALADAPPILPFAQLRVEPRALVVVVSNVADPGNLGAIARVAEAAGATALVRSGGARPFGDKALRGSMGSLLRLAVHELDDPAEIRARGWRLVAASTRGGADPRRFDWSGPIALWISGEVGGAPPPGAEAVTLPMAGRVESLNVATAAALLLYAAGRV